MLKKIVISAVTVFLALVAWMAILALVTPLILHQADAQVPPGEGGSGHPLPLRGYWKFNEGSDENVYDSSPYQNHGKIHNATWVSGLPGTALHFEGNDGSYVEIPDASELTPDTELTIEANIKPESYPTWHSAVIYKGKLQQTGCFGERSYAIWARADGGLHFVFTLEGENCQREYWTNEGMIQLNQWNHIKIHLDTKKELVEVFVNSEKVYTEERKRFIDAPMASKKIMKGDSPLRIGGMFRSLGDQSNFQGSIDDVKIYVEGETPPENQLPVCTLYANPDSGEAPLEVKFTLNANDPDGSIASWKLDVNNNGIVEYSGLGNPPLTQQHTYQDSGTYMAKLTVTDNKGAEGCCEKMINVSQHSKSTTFKAGDYIKVIAKDGWNLCSKPKLEDANILRPPSPLPKGSMGQILEHENNGIFTDGHYWWYVKFGKYEGWCAEEGLKKFEFLSRKEKLKFMIHQERIVEKDVSVFVDGNQYIIATLGHKINPETLKIIENVENFKVYLDLQEEPVSNLDVTLDIAIIDYVRDLQENELKEEKVSLKMEELVKKGREIPDWDFRDKTLDSVIDLIKLLNIPHTTGEAIIKLVKKVSVEKLFNTMENLRSQTLEYFYEAVDNYLKIYAMLYGTGNSDNVREYEIAKEVLDRYQLARNREEIANFLFSRIYEGDVGKLIERILNNLLLGIPEEIVAIDIEKNLFEEEIAPLRFGVIKPYPYTYGYAISTFNLAHESEEQQSIKDALPNGYAIIVAGRSESLDKKIFNPLITYNANTTYRTLRNLGFDDEHIFYLNSDQWQDIDDNGDNDVDAMSSSKNFEKAIERASHRVKKYTPLIIVLIGHGKDEVFFFNEAKGTQADGIVPLHLNSLLDNLPDETPKLIVIDACDSGGFIHPEDQTISIPDKNRVIITSTHNKQKWHPILKGGLYSGHFFRNLNKGFNIKDAFIKTQHDKHAWLDDNGDAIGTNPVDLKKYPPKFQGDEGWLAQNMWIGIPNSENIELKPFVKIWPFSPVDIQAYDSRGRVTGLINGEVKEEIPNSVYDKENKVVLIFDAIDEYDYKIVGMAKGTYGLKITSNKTGEIITFTATDIPTTPEEIHQYTIDWDALSQGKEGTTLKIDFEGDGEFDKTINTSATLQPPIANAGSDQTAYVGDTITLDGSGSSDPEGDALTYHWNFGDGNSALGKVVSHSYSNAGSYTAILTVTDEDGLTATDEVLVTINERPAVGGGGAVFIPTLAIPDESIRVSNIGEDTTTISWSTPLFSTSRVIYSSEDESHNYKPDNPPNYGYAHSTEETSAKATGHKVTLTDLSPGTTYYYRCISASSPEVISQEYSFITLGVKTEKKEEKIPLVETPEEKEEIVILPQPISEETPLVETEKISEEIPEETEKIVQEEQAEQVKEITKTQTASPIQKEIPTGLLASLGMIWEATSQSPLKTIFVILLLVALALMIVREGRRQFQKKRNK